MYYIPFWLLGTTTKNVYGENNLEGRDWRLSVWFVWFNRPRNVYYILSVMRLKKVIKFLLRTKRIKYKRPGVRSNYLGILFEFYVNNRCLFSTGVLSMRIRRIWVKPNALILKLCVFISSVRRHRLFLTAEDACAVFVSRLFHGNFSILRATVVFTYTRIFSEESGLKFGIVSACQIS